MQIDLITVSAQLINFLILVWLLKRFLFTPVLDVMKRREALIDEQLTEASTKIAEAEAMKYSHQKSIALLEKNKRDILDTTTKKADEENKRILAEALLDNQIRRKAWHDSLELEKREVADSFRTSIASCTRYVTDALLRRISNQNLNQQMLDSFIDQLATLDSQAKEKISANPTVINIISAMPISSEAQYTLTKVVQEELGVVTSIDFQVDEQLIAGVQLNVDGLVLKWSVHDMLDDLDDELSRTLEQIGASN